jgi:hypothetical protein
MNTYKNVSGDYIITVDSGDGNVIINGNLNVEGNVTYIETTELKVDDPFILVAAHNIGPNEANALFFSQGLVTKTSSSTYAGLRFDNDSLTWQISPNVNEDGSEITAYQTIGVATAGSVGGPLYSIQIHDAGNVFGGYSDFSYDYANDRVTLQGHLSFGNVGTAPPATANTVALYHNQQGSGGTGLYVKSSITEDELVSKSAAIVFSIIF